MSEIVAAPPSASIVRIFLDASNGTEDDPTQQGFWELAKEGKETWNYWHRRQQKTSSVPTVNFAGCRFTESTDFSGFEFGAFADFQAATFEKRADFSEALFGSSVNFVGASFRDDVVFDSASFENEAQFRGTQFAFGASFNKARFGVEATFFGAQFGDDSDFDGAIFGDGARFDGCNWAVLGLAYESAFTKLKEWGESQEMSPQTFETITFRGCKFFGNVDFSNREFLGPATWAPLDDAPTVFARAPKFHNCKLHQDTSFDRVTFPAPTGSEVAARAYRTLKLASAQQQSTREEQRFFKLEMAEEHRMSTWGQRSLYSVYEFLSEYGFSTGRPLAFLLVTLLGSWLLYGILAGLSPCLPWTKCSISRQWFEFGLINALPLPGFDRYVDGLRTDLFASRDGLVPVLVTTVVIVQKTFSLVAIFLLGLGLRNLFKMK